jgi:nitroreductase/dihydropteridine reductase
MSFLANLTWRYATKKFDTAQQVSDADLQTIRNAIRLAPTSYGVQMFSVVEVASPALRDQMKASSFGQPQVTDASHFFVFCARADIEQRIETMFTEMSGGNEAVRAGALAGYEGMVRGALLSRSKEQLFTWSQKNAGIALGFALAACAELKIDACPMDGFDPLAVKAVLNLSDDFLPVAYLAIGYRDSSDEAAQRPKYRISDQEIFTQL